MKSLAEVKEIAKDHNRLADLIKIPFKDWHSKCHLISYQLLCTGEFGPGRIARGWAPLGPAGQHSWIVLGSDCYDPGAILVDPTLEFWMQKAAPQIMVNYAHLLPHQPHGAGELEALPHTHGETPIELTPSRSLSLWTRTWLEACGPLDMMGWHDLANGPMLGWPAKEVITAMKETRTLAGLVPIDITGMVTDQNPGDAYLCKSGPGQLPSKK